MKFISGKVIGFGKWQDVTFDFTGRSLICFYGENESGKSTLRNFFLFMLFGLPPKQREFYRPKTGGNMGGRLTIWEEETGLYTVERLDHVQNGAAVCYLENGMTMSEDWFKERLRGMTRKQYEAIFSFSATELNELDKVDERDLGEILLSVSISGSQRIYFLEKELEKKMSDLFKPYGKKPVINQQLEKLVQLHHSLKKMQSEEAAYREKVNASEQTEKQILKLKGDIEQKKQKLYELEKVKQVLPVLEDYRNAALRLKADEWQISFPEHGLERLQHIRSQLLPLCSELTVLKENAKNINKKIETLAAKRLEENIYQKAQSLGQRIPLFQQQQEKYAQLNEKAKEIKVQLDTELERLNLPLTQEQLLSVTMPFHLEQQWNQLKQEQSQVQLEEKRLQEEEISWKQERQALSAKMDALAEEMQSDEEYLSSKRKLEEEKEKHYMQKLQSEWQRQQAMWKKKTKKKEKLARNFLFLSIVISVSAAIFGFFQEETAFYLFSIFFFLTGFIPWLLQKQAAKEMANVFQQPLNAQGRTDLKEDKSLAEEVRKQESLRQEYQKLKDMLLENELRHRRIKEQRKVVLMKKEAIAEQLRKQYVAYPFLKEVDVTYWPELYHAVKRLIAKGQELQDVEEQISFIQSSLLAFEKELQQFFQSEEKASSLLERLNTLLTAEERYEKEITHYRELLAEIEQKLQQLQKKLEVYENEKDQLLLSAGAETEDDFYEKAKKLEEKQGMVREMRQCKRQLNTVFPEEIWQLWLKRNVNEASIEYEFNLLSEEIDRLEKELEQLQEKNTFYQAEIQKMESSETYSTLLHQFTLEKEELEHLAKQWSVYKTAIETLNETKRQYQEKYLVKVIEKQSEIFRSLTGGKYIKVYPPMEGMPFQVEDEQGTRFVLPELSQGTIHQLYIALRLAISIMFQKTYPFPFIIDDAFLHFDSIRLHRMITQIQKLSETQQVLLFTCKEEIVASFSDNDKIILESQFA